ncbi:Hsp20/alpha crystallin family protein [Priestia megaterium]|nr:Hsp20/alpha crystallin family protein [Priestia megaterium]
MNKKHLPTNQTFVKSFQELLEVVFSNPFMSYLDYDSVRVDLFETEDAYIVEAELPGYHPKNIMVHVQEDSLHLIATKQTIHELFDESKNTFSKETCEEKVEKMIDFPFSLREKKIEGTFKNYLLEVTIFKQPVKENLSKTVPIVFE